MSFVFLFIVALIAWFFGSIAAGGVAVIFVFGASFFLPLAIIPVLMSVIGSISGAYSFYLYRKDINWKIARWLILGTFLGALIGTKIFANLVDKGNTHVLSIIIGIVLTLIGIYGLTFKNAMTTKVKEHYFFLITFFTSIISSVIGAGSPLVNVLFQRTSLTPVQIVGTKFFGTFTMQVTKLIMYIVFLRETDFFEQVNGLYSTQAQFTLIGSCMAGSLLGVYLSRRYLTRMKTEGFNTVINVSFILFGIYFLLL